MDKHELVSQGSLADYLGVSQSWLSEATRKGRKVAGHFDPAACAVYDEAENLAGYRVDEETRCEIRGQKQTTSLQDTGSAQDVGGERLPPALAVNPTKTIRPLTGLQSHESHYHEHHEESHQRTTVSLLPPGADLSGSTGFLGVAYFASNAAHANPAVVPTLVRGLLTSGGAYVGYEVEGSTTGAVIGGAFGFLITMT